MSNADHIELADMLLKLKGKAILSGYDTPIYDRLLDWEKIDLGDMAVTMNKKIGEPRIKKREFVWVNFEKE